MRGQQVSYSNNQLKKHTVLKLIILSIFPPVQQFLLLPAKWAAILCKSDETPEINACSRGSIPMMKEPTYPDSVHLFMLTAERLAVFMNLAVTQYIFIA